MIYLILVSIIWALSFSLIKGSLTGINSNLVAFIRLGISFFVFLPFLKLNELNKKLFIQLIFIGMIQYGLMYVAYIYSYQFLQANQVAILTIFTPFFIVFISDFFEKKFNISNFVSALLAVIGAGIIIYSHSQSPNNWQGILLIQISNLCFAFGQVYFKKMMKKHHELKPHQFFSIIYLGAVFTAAIFSFFSVNFSSVNISLTQWIILLYLGIVASGIGFFLWNVGVTKVKAGTLAVMNNLKIPFAVLFAFILLGESIDVVRIIIGFSFIIIALIVNIKFK